jgi:hypothetical protein
MMRFVLIYFNKLLKIRHTFNLEKLGLMFGTDKAIGHFYLPHYQKHFSTHKFKKIRLLEIGVGGYKAPNFGGHSLRLWKSYFPFAHIFAIDIYDKSPLQEKRISIFKGSQVDEVFLTEVLAKTGDLDIIIDDGSHINEHVIKTFNILFPKLKDGGVYVIEDIQTSYWKDYGGDSENLNNPNTIMGYFKNLVDGLNHVEQIKSNFKPTYFDKHIIAMHFYHNLIFIYKGQNNELSNLVVNNQRS